MGSTREKTLFGRSVPRIEDRALVIGRGRFLDDIKPAGCLSAAFVRSPHAHATFSRIDVKRAQEMPGVVAVLTATEIRPFLSSERLIVGLPSPGITLQVDRPILAKNEVTYVGEAVAVVIARSRPEAEDAVETIDINFEPLPAVADCRSGLNSATATVHRSIGHNCLAKFSFTYGDAGDAFRKAAHRAEGSYRIHRGGSHSIEGRGVLAMLDPITDVLSVWSSTQTPQALKNSLCELLSREEDTVRVSAPDVGGGFGPKLVTYPEEIVIAIAALVLRTPVKWVEDRREHFISATQERDQFWDLEMALDADGLILAIRGTMLHDHGAYTARGLNIPYGSGVTVPLPYNVPSYSLEISVVLTNKVPVTPVRGAGQPQAAFVMERLMDKAASRLGLDRAEIRRRNLVRPEQMPCLKPLSLRGGTKILLDSGDYPMCQANALAHADWAGFDDRKRAARSKGRRLGIGMANYVEGTGRGPYESVEVSISRSGRVLVKTGAAAMGQGTATMLAQIVGEQLGSDLSNISVTTSSNDIAFGFGGFNSRQTVTAGASAHKAAVMVRKKLLQVASHIMEVAEEDLTIRGRKVVVGGVEEMGVSFAQAAIVAAGLPGFQLPAGLQEPGLSSLQQVNINDMAFSNGSAVAEVEVDEQTGHVRVVKFTLSHDCGRMVNPVTVDGQILGGIAHGIGNALYEEMLFDDNAQPLTTTFADYLLVTAAEMPETHISHMESPSPLNELGVKGVGESGTIPVTAAVAAAIDDALSDLSIHVNCMPITPQALKRLLQEAGARP
jgi:aerobic carbon-monoxide dehydrogenase large subunit